MLGALPRGRRLAVFPCRAGGLRFFLVGGGVGDRSCQPLADDGALGLAESDLGWGQKLASLVRVMNRTGIATCRLTYFGTAESNQLYPGAFGTCRGGKRQAMAA